tara:strand:- start:1801 stop:2034 length:234 start_codon:yes stop_codon:yes gene_type:complete
MISNISIYLYPDTIAFLNKNTELIQKISQDTKTKININKRRYDPYVSIEGKFEDYHKARIILQEIEKSNYTNKNKFD